MKQLIYIKLLVSSNSLSFQQFFFLSSYAEQQSKYQNIKITLHHKMMTLKLTQLRIQFRTTLSGMWSKQIFKMRSTNSPMIKFGKHQRTKQQAYRVGDISSTTSSHGGRTIFQEQSKGYLLEMHVISQKLFLACVAPVLFKLDEKGYRAVMYADDLTFLHKRGEYHQTVELLANMFQKIGLVINKDK
ncbi:Hypothetical_protein [Hexamita inflata]|uniref:Hypothetical_protein n=1 Tax=Hexamita inflata TaxID=28002 RepID=A0ABP1IKT9_9EUKA